MNANKKLIKIAMARSCMNAADLAAASGLPRPTVNNVIAGRNIRPATIGKVAKALGVDPVELIEEDTK